MTPLILALAISTHAQVACDSVYSNVVVRPRQTVSWLALRYLGGFSPAIADTLRMDNPGIPDLGKLRGGETLRLRRSMDRRPLPPDRQIELASRQAVVTTIKGQGEIRRANGSIEPLAANRFLSTGDEVRLGAGASAELVIDNQSVLRLRENSRLRIQGVQDASLARGRKAGTRVALDAGSLWVKVRTWAGPLVGFEVSLPSVIAGVHGTVFETTVKEDTTQIVAVREGVVAVRELREGGKEVELSKGQTISVHPNDPMGEPTAPAVAPEAPWPEEFQDTDVPVDAKVRQRGVGKANHSSAKPIPPDSECEHEQ